VWQETVAISIVTRARFRRPSEAGLNDSFLYASPLLGKPALRAQTVQKSGQFFHVSFCIEVMTGDKSPALRRSNREKNSRSRLQSASLITPCSFDFPGAVWDSQFLTTDGSKRRTAVAGLRSEPPRERVPQLFRLESINTGIRRSGIARCVMALLWLGSHVLPSLRFFIA